MCVRVFAAVPWALSYPTGWELTKRILGIAVTDLRGGYARVGKSSRARRSLHTVFLILCTIYQLLNNCLSKSYAMRENNGPWRRGCIIYARKEEASCINKAADFMCRGCSRIVEANDGLSLGPVSILLSISSQGRRV